ncbi:MAG: hypothetical protein F6K26_04570 [Moorea sp. SIO2I5]|nr:hypothetical protein [Moorena sp. SIO2I5]
MTIGHAARTRMATLREKLSAYALRVASLLPIPCSLFPVPYSLCCSRDRISSSIQSLQ